MKARLRFVLASFIAATFFLSGILWARLPNGDPSCFEGTPSPLVRQQRGQPRPPPRSLTCADNDFPPSCGPSISYWDKTSDCSLPASWSQLLWYKCSDESKCFCITRAMVNKRLINFGSQLARDEDVNKADCSGGIDVNKDLTCVKECNYPPDVVRGGIRYKCPYPLTRSSKSSEWVTNCNYCIQETVYPTLEGRSNPAPPLFGKGNVQLDYQQCEATAKQLCNSDASINQMQDAKWQPAELVKSDICKVRSDCVYFGCARKCDVQSPDIQSFEHKGCLNDCLAAMKKNSDVCDPPTTDKRLDEILP